MKLQHDQPPELFSPERPVRSDFARGSVGVPYAVRRIITLAVLAAVLIGGGTWMWGHFFASAPGEVPVIKADGSYKQRPEQPGGIDIPHQDVQVYHEIDGSAAATNAKPAVEHMLPPPEQPDTAAMVPQQTSVDTDKSGQMESLIQKVAPPAVVEAPAPVATMPAPAAAPTPQAVTQVVKQPEVKEVTPAPTPTAAAALKPTAPSKGNVVLQLAALPDQNAAQNKAQELQTKYASILGAAKLHPVRANLGAKGVFYRIQSQSMSEAQASSMCAAIKNAHGGCLLVRR